jgi:hypothetical protein
MNRVKKGVLAFGLLLFLFIGSTLTLKSISADDFGEENEFTILEAYYGDFDNDSIEDDIKVVVLFETEHEGIIYSVLNLKITLPSGNSFKFTFQVSFISDDSSVIITFTTFNTAIESGWYIAEVSGIFLIDGYLCYLTDSITFDPPTGEEEGEPGAIVTVTDGN